MSKKTVKIYSTPTCTYCDKAKEFFKENNIKFTEYNVKEDLDRRTEMFEISGQKGVPVIVIGDDVLTGFSEFAVKQFLGL